MVSDTAVLQMDQFKNLTMGVANGILSGELLYLTNHLSDFNQIWLVIFITFSPLSSKMSENE